MDSSLIPLFCPENDTRRVGDGAAFKAAGPVSAVLALHSWPTSSRTTRAQVDLYPCEAGYRLAGLRRATDRVGGLYRDADDWITPALTERFDAISRSIPELHYGQYGVRFDAVERPAPPSTQPFVQSRQTP